MLVEDEDLKAVIIGVMRHHLGYWPPIERKEEWPAHITVAHSAEEVLKENGLIAQLKESSVRALGIVVDANSNFDGRWQRIRNFCLAHSAAVIPDRCPETGLAVYDMFGTRLALGSCRTIKTTEC